MPAFNASPYVREAIESLLNQSFSDFQLWVIDDASTDDTFSIVSALTANDARIVLFRNATNLGRLRTINAKVKEVTSTFFTVTDADDVSHPLRLEKQMVRLTDDPALMMCGTSYVAMDTAGYFIRSVHVPTEIEALRTRSLVQSAFMGGTTVMRSIVRNDFPELYRSYFTNSMADADLACRILDKYPSTNIDELLYFYRIVPTSITRSKVTSRSLNIYKLIGKLSSIRRTEGKDWLETGMVAFADDFMMKIEDEYAQDRVLWLRHQSFFYLYWGQNSLALKSIAKAFVIKPYHIKTAASFLLVSMRVTLFYMIRSFKKVHYRALFK